MFDYENDPLRRYFKSFYYHDLYPFKDIFTIGITGTCGKTSTSLYLYYFLKKHNYDVLYIGTHKIYYQNKIIETKNTTLEIDVLIKHLIKNNINPKYIVMEVSSIGINEARINAFKFDILGLTNLGFDHLDYHLNLNNYHQTKLAFLNTAYKLKGLFIPYEYKNLITNKKSFFFKVKKDYFHDFTNLEYDYNNLYLAFLILRKMHFSKKVILNDLKNIKLNNGRGQIIYNNNHKIVIDYAHSVEAFETILSSDNNLKVVVFGCGGNRDFKKRFIMGKIALKYCFKVIVTKDNSRNENIDNIIKDITNNNPNFIIIKDREKAIKDAILNYSDCDIYILGKGDETFIEENNIHIPFNDYDCVMKYLHKD